MTPQPSRSDPSGLSLRTPRGLSAHFVEFYVDDDALVGSVATYIATGIARGEAGIVIAEEAHRSGIDAALSRSFDLEGARVEGRYLSADAEEALHLFMNDGVPDVADFDHVIGELIERASEGGRHVRVFGEMVGILWRRGHLEGALLLEDAWNRLADHRGFKLYCAYPHDAGLGEGAASISSQHSHVILPAATM